MVTTWHIKRLHVHKPKRTTRWIHERAQPTRKINVGWAFLCYCIFKSIVCLKWQFMQTFFASPIRFWILNKIFEKVLIFCINFNLGFDCRFLVEIFLQSCVENVFVSFFLFFPALWLAVLLLAVLPFVFCIFVLWGFLLSFLYCRSIDKITLQKLLERHDKKELFFWLGPIC